jgi:uncharacterized protein (TIGR02145 family)
MEKRQNFSIFPFLIMGVFLVFTSSCEKDEDNNPALNNPTTGKTTAVFNPSVTYGTMTDQDGNVYKTVTIGTQTWMAENLRTTKYNDGTAIPNATSDVEWESLSTGAYCNNKNTINTGTIATYGRLYNWYAVNTGKLAPKGWHVPTDAEWTELTDKLGGENVAGGKLKEAGTAHWISPNTSATNETGFTALPGGSRDYDGAFIGVGYWGNWWSATERYPSSAWSSVWTRHTTATISELYTEGYLDKGSGLSVRCIRD